jgi:hypothetical protein
MLTGTPGRKRPIGRHRLRWKDNIKIDLTKIWMGKVDWIHLTQDIDLWRAFVNTVMDIRIPYQAGNFLTS